MSHRQPTIILGMPADNHIYQTLKAGLRYHGFQVINAVLNNQAFHYPSLASRLKVKFQQYVLRNRHAKRELKSKLLLNALEQQIAAAGVADYALFIRGDIYSPEFLTAVKRHVRHSMVNYQWDGLDRFPDIKTCANLFDKLYVFDPADLHKGLPCFPATNFYFDHNLTPHDQASRNLYFVGLHDPKRTPSILTFVEAAQKYELSLDFSIGHQTLSPQALRSHYPETIHTFIGTRTFEDNLKAAQRAGVLVDFKTAAHNGLSFRAFEALGYRKKLITTNADIQKYDFYHPDNIFIWDGQHLDGLDAFLAKPLHAFPPELYEKYSFGNWIRYILDIQPHQKITLPE